MKLTLRDRKKIAKLSEITRLKQIAIESLSSREYDLLVRKYHEKLS
jgi:hypothetical protein